MLMIWGVSHQVYLVSKSKLTLWSHSLKEMGWIWTQKKLELLAMSDGNSPRLRSANRHNLCHILQQCKVPTTYHRRNQLNLTSKRHAGLFFALGSLGISLLWETKSLNCQWDLWGVCFVCLPLRVWELAPHWPSTTTVREPSGRNGKISARSA